MQFLSEGLIDGKPVITGVVPASQALQAFALACDKLQSLKVQIDFQAALA